MSGGPGSSDPTRIQYRYVSPLDLIGRAYDLPWYQINGPSWLGEVFFDISAIVPDGATTENFRIMLQTLLVERFHLNAHREARVVPIYVLAQAKGGTKLKPAPPADGTPHPPSPVAFFPMGSSFRLTGPSATIASLVSSLVRYLKRPVVDQTELSGLYGVDLRFQPDSATLDPNSAPGADAPSLFSGIREQLGLELRESKGPIDTIVIESMDREPQAN